LLLSQESPVPLTPKAFDVLLVLVQNGKRLTTKEELMQKVWPDSFVEEANLTVNISALRRLLGRMEDGQQYIVTVPKKGYRFVAPVSEVLEKPSNGEHPANEISIRADQKPTFAITVLQQNVESTSVRQNATCRRGRHRKFGLHVAVLRRNPK
jgi:DNA-binding winged helix-turn-helix (wHTH) protein